MVSNPPTSKTTRRARGITTERLEVTWECPVHVAIPLAGLSNHTQGVRQPNSLVVTSWIASIEQTLHFEEQKMGKGR